MVYSSRPFFFRLLCFLLACLILANALFVPVRASVLLEVLAATTRNMIASLIRACGVYVADGIGGSLADGLETWEMLVDYVASKVPAKYLYINAAGEKFVKMILQDGLYYADRNLVEWVLSTLFETGENSSGEVVKPIGFGYPNMDNWMVDTINSLLSDCESRGRYYSSYLRDYPYCTFIEFTPSYDYGLYYSPIVVFSETDFASVYHNESTGYFSIYIPDGGGVYFWKDENGLGNGQLRSSSSDSYKIEMTAAAVNDMYFEGTTTVQVHGGFGGTFEPIRSTYADPVISSTWNDKAISVTDNRVGGTVTALPVTVYNSTTESAQSSFSSITSGSFVQTDIVSVPNTNTGTDVVPDVTTGQEVVPDSTTGSDVVPDTDVSTQAGFWATLLSWVETIWTTLKDILSGVLAIPIAIAQAIATAIADVIAAIKSLVPEPPTFSDFQIPGLKDFFPFCIPFDLLAMMRALSASPVAPSFVFACPLPSGGIYEVNIDLSAWNGVASTIRSVIVAIYVVTLANSTRKFIKW